MPYCWDNLLTLDSISENGKPLSRANDQTCREAVAISVIVLAINEITRTDTIAFVAL